MRSWDLLLHEHFQCRSRTVASQILSSLLILKPITQKLASAYKAICRILEQTIYLVLFSRYHSDYYYFKHGMEYFMWNFYISSVKKKASGC
jgi:hypothetical protein